jgi:hypothetical protein
LARIADTALPLKYRGFPPDLREEIERLRGLGAGEREQELLRFSERISQQNEADFTRERAAVAAERNAQSALVRELFGNPFHPKTVQRSWLTWQGGTIPRLAQAIYDERAFDRLPILADALEEAGCTSEEILSHCRGPGPHCKGCWVVDAVLEKS